MQCDMIESRFLLGPSPFRRCRLSCCRRAVNTTGHCNGILGIHVGVKLLVCILGRICFGLSNYINTLRKPRSECLLVDVTVGIEPLCEFASNLLVLPVLARRCFITDMEAVGGIVLLDNRFQSELNSLVSPRTQIIRVSRGRTLPSVLPP